MEAWRVLKPLLKRQRAATMRPSRRPKPVARKLLKEVDLGGTTACVSEVKEGGARAVADITGLVAFLVQP